ncbi:GGDEF domain-containing protein [Motilibacter aurantiacus]|uniref:GGDEF domain-containing protein n=1 Tax=Motilibacter aurantiacus TaxID=2714955 RepID=UPI00140B40F2|nr:GGDEF domain-containing protein [Motilibacter aurantiacus]NHC44800.1 GGDEF domain-containing protein [Motilibacter aurantiacus]
MPARTRDEPSCPEIPVAAFSDAFELTPSCLALVGRDGTVMPNAALRAALRRSGTEMLDQLVSSVDWSFASPARPPDGSGLRGLPVEDGRSELVVRSIRPLGVTDGGPEWLLLCLQATTTRRRDALSSLLTRDQLLDRLELVLAAGAEAVGAVGAVDVLVVDLDDFKKVNDTFGHVVGDEVLAACAQRLLESVRPEDAVARWGGDEFAIVLPDATCLDGQAVSDRLARRLRERVATSAGSISLSASWGWVSALPGEAPVSLLNRADLRMYEVKRLHKQAAAAIPTALREQLERTRRRSAELAQRAADMRQLTARRAELLAGVRLHRPSLRAEEPPRG